MNYKIPLFITILLLLVNISYSQSVTSFPYHQFNKHSFSILHKIDSTELCNIFLISNSVLKDVRIINSDDTSFTVTKDHNERDFMIPQINKIQFEGHGFWKGFAYGGTASIVIFGLLGLLGGGNGGDSWFKPLDGFAIGTILGIPIGLVCGAIFEFTSTDTNYDFNSSNSELRSKLLKFIRLKHKY